MGNINILATAINPIILLICLTISLYSSFFPLVVVVINALCISSLQAMRSNPERGNIKGFLDRHVLPRYPCSPRDDWHSEMPFACEKTTALSRKGNKAVFLFFIVLKMPKAAPA